MAPLVVPQPAQRGPQGEIAFGRLQPSHHRRIINAASPQEDFSWRVQHVDQAVPPLLHDVRSPMHHSVMRPRNPLADASEDPIPLTPYSAQHTSRGHVTYGMALDSTVEYLAYTCQGTWDGEGSRMPRDDNNIVNALPMSSTAYTGAESVPDVLYLGLDSPPRPALDSKRQSKRVKRRASAPSELVIKQEFPSTWRGRVNGEDSSSIPRSPRLDRTPHSLVERRYRANLNKKITALQGALPESLVSLSNKDSDKDEETHKAKPSKAGIIAAALVYINSLQHEMEGLKSRRQVLEERIVDLEEDNRALVEFHEGFSFS